MSETESPKAEPSADSNPNHKRGSNSSEDQTDGGGVVKKLKTERFLEIEADAAEDKGSRHTMEDTSVVLLDATADSPTNLRSIPSYIHCVRFLICNYAYSLNLELNKYIVVVD